MNHHVTNTAYLESYNYIHIYLSKKIDISEVKIIDSLYESFKLNIVSCDFIDNLYRIIVTSDIMIEPHLVYRLYVNDIEIPLKIGRITTTSLFEERTYFDGWLGYKFTNSYVIFRLWAPVSKEVELVINDYNSYQMKYIGSGVYEAKVFNKNNNLDGLSYHYLIKNDFEFIKVIDPYAISVNDDYSNAFIIDLKKTYELENSFVDKNIETLIYELNVRDFTISLPLKNKGLFLGMSESSTLDNHGINYLVNLGISHVQLSPIFAFGGVNNNIKDGQDPKFLYNWGYNPVFYNALSPWYTTNTNNPYNSINEFKIMVDSIHKKGIGVILDVVYNHVYNVNEFALNKIVPGYFFRYYTNGDLSNGSWCGNDVASERQMNRKFILDSLTYYQNEFKIDGFRFDLMGLIDIDTMLKAKELLTKVNKNTLIYGEGWQMATSYDTSRLAHMFNSKEVAGISFFNDYFRNTLKGKAEYNRPGILIKGEHSKETFESLFSGMKIFNDFNQSINYVECHDNATFYDEQKKLGINNQEIKENAKLALIFVLFAKGISFIHSGQEILRSKQGIENSYNSPDVINKFPWHLTIFNSDLLEYFKTLVKIKNDIGFKDYTLSKVTSKDKYVKVIYTKERTLFNLYINLKNNNISVDIGNETLLYGPKKKANGYYNMNKGVLITLYQE